MQNESIYAEGYEGPYIQVPSELDFIQNESQYNNQEAKWASSQTAYQQNQSVMAIPQEQEQYTKENENKLLNLLEIFNQREMQKEIENKQLLATVNALEKKFQNSKSSEIFEIYMENGMINLQGAYGERYPLCLNFITFVVWVIVKNVSEQRRFMAIGLMDQKVTFFSERELMNGTLLKKLRISTGERIEVSGIADSKIIKAFTNYLLKEVEKNEKIIIPKTAGWDLENKKFYYMPANDIFESILKNGFPEHPLIRRTLWQESNNDTNSVPFPKRLQNTLWEVTLFGSVIRSLLNAFGFKKFFGIWLYDDIRSRIFINTCLKIWNEYIPEGDVGSTKELKEIFSESKDELVIVREHIPSTTSKNNIERILHCLETGCEFSKGISINSTPIFVTKSYEIFQKKDDIVVFPFLFREDDVFESVDISCRIVPSYLKWCEERFSKEVLQCIKDMVNGYKPSPEYENLPFIKLFMTIKVLIQVYFHYQEKNPNDNKIKISNQKIKEIEKQVTMFLQYITNFNNTSAIETVRNYLIDSYNNGEIRIQSVDDVTIDGLKNSLIYDKEGYTYISKDMFNELTKVNFYKSMRTNLVQRLLSEEVLEKEKNGDGRWRADIKVSIPRGCGREQNRFYKFKPKVLLNESGYLIGTTQKIDVNNSIILGTDNYNYEIHYPYLDSGNMHITATGVTGSGKTTLVHKIVYQICRLGIPCILFDYSQSFNKLISQPELTEIVDITDFPINPFVRRNLENSLEAIDDCALRGAEILKKAFNLKAEDEDIIFDILGDILENNQIPTLENIYQKIEKKDIKNNSNLKKLKKFYNKKIFLGNSSNWNIFLSGKAKLKVIRMDKLMKDDAALLTDLLLLDLIEWRIRQAEIADKLVLWLDEIQNLTPAEEMISVLLREMRKFGIGVIAVSQAFHDMSNKMQTSLQQAALKLYFCQDTKGARKFANDEALTESERRKLAKEARNLSKGDFYAVGNFLDVNGDICDTQCRKVYK